MNRFALQKVSMKSDSIFKPLKNLFLNSEY